MPFGGNCEFADFAACVRANSDKENPDAYCAELMRQTEEHCNREAPEMRVKKPEIKIGDLVRKTAISVEKDGAAAEIVDRMLWVTASAETPDRDDDVIYQGKTAHGKGWDLSQYDPNPVIMGFHDYRQPPIGLNQESKIVKGAKAKNAAGAPELWMRPKFAENQLGDFFLDQYVKGYMRAWSVGFAPTKWDYRYENDVAPTDSEAYDQWPIGYYFYEQALWELSAVPIPSNPDALTHMRSAFKSKFGGDLATLPVYDGLIKNGLYMLRGGVGQLPGVTDDSGELPMLTMNKTAFNIVVPEWATKGAVAENVDDVANGQASPTAGTQHKCAVDCPMCTNNMDMSTSDMPAASVDHGTVKDEADTTAVDNGGSEVSAGELDQLASAATNVDDEADDLTDEEVDEIAGLAIPVAQELLEVLAST